jgi:hypothetical protein
MSRREELGARIRDALDRHSNNASYNEMAQAFFGMDVAAHEGTEPYTAGVVQGWMYGTILPQLDTLRAIAKAAGFHGTVVGLRWLVYGSAYAAHAVEPEEYRRFYEAEKTAGILR